MKSQIVNSANRLTIQDLFAKLVELSGEELQQIVGGNEPVKPFDLTVQGGRDEPRGQHTSIS